MTSASGRTEHTTLKIQNFNGIFPELNTLPAQTATAEWVMMVGKTFSCYEINQISLTQSNNSKGSILIFPTFNVPFIIIKLHIISDKES